MSRFYFHVENGDGYEPDREGREFSDQEAAIVEAGRAAGDIIAEDLRKGRDGVTIKIHVEDASHRHVARVAIEGSVIR